jgi:hypothetical protein
MPAGEVLLQPVDIVNRALARIGGGHILSLDADGDLEASCQLLYADITEAALGKFDWRFANKTFALSRLADAPLIGWRFAYDLPGERLGAPVAIYSQPRRPDQPLRDFKINGSELHCDHETVWVDCKVKVDPSIWPPEFRVAVTTWLAAELAVPVAHDLALSQSLRQIALGRPEESGIGGLIGMAIAKEIGRSPPEAGYADDVLTSARHAGVSWSG